MTGWVAKRYDKSSRASRIDELSGYADLVCAHAPAGASVLEVAPGPGYLAIELARRGFLVTGVDVSADFVGIERRNAADASVSVDFKQGNAAALPVANETFDFVVCTAAFKGFREPAQALAELWRVLKPGGTALIIDLNGDATKEDIEAGLAASGVKGIDRVLIRLSFAASHQRRAYTRDGFERLISGTSFASAKIKAGGMDLQVWLRKGD